MIPGRWPIVRTKGDTFRFRFQIVDSVTGPWNLSTYTARFQVKESSISTTNLLSLSTGNGITMTSDGYVTITAPATAMDFPAGKYVYDFELTSAGNEVTTIVADRFILNPEVSY